MKIEIKMKWNRIKRINMELIWNSWFGALPERTVSLTMPLANQKPGMARACTSKVQTLKHYGNGLTGLLATEKRGVIKTETVAKTPGLHLLCVSRKQQAIMNMHEHFSQNWKASIYSWSTRIIHHKSNNHQASNNINLMDRAKQNFTSKLQIF